MRRCASVLIPPHCRKGSMVPASPPCGAETRRRSPKTLKAETNEMPGPREAETGHESVRGNETAVCGRHVGGRPQEPTPSLGALKSTYTWNSAGIARWGQQLLEGVSWPVSSWQPYRCISTRFSHGMCERPEFCEAAPQDCTDDCCTTPRTNHYLFYGR